jgi:TPR repeat protein
MYNINRPSSIILSCACLLLSSLILWADSVQEAQELYWKGYDEVQEVVRNKSQDFGSAIKYLEEASELGSADAMQELMQVYDRLARINRGKSNTEPLLKKSSYWALRAAHAGNIYAQHSIAFKYLEGEGVEQDYELAEFWYRKAAENGDDLAQDMIDTYTRGGLTFAEGAQLEEDKNSNTYAQIPEDDLFDDIKKKAELGNPEAIFYMGLIHEDGSSGAVQDFNTSLFWYDKAIKLGSSEALVRKGIIHINPKFEARKFSVAIDSFLEAADEGEVEAYQWLGYMYKQGYGFPKNNQRAVEFYTKGALAGVAKSQAVLSILTANGTGIVQNEIDGYAWALLASEGGEHTAKAYLEPLERSIKILAQERAARFKELISRSEENVSSLDGQTGGSFGSGLLFNGRYVLTANHVISGSNKIEVSTGGSIHNAALLFSDEGSDIAVLDLGYDLPQSIDLILKDAGFGENVFTIGYPNVQIQGNEAKYTAGVVSSLSGIGDDTRFIQITVPVQPGNSGGPLFSDGGALVGVVVSQLDAQKVMEQSGSIPQNVNYATNSGVVRILLKKHGIYPKESTDFLNYYQKIDVLKQATVLVQVDVD